MNKNKIIKEYKEFLKEDILNLDDIKKVDNFLDITKEEKNILKGFYDIVEEIKKIKFTLDDFDVKESTFDEGYYIYYVILPIDIKNLIEKMVNYYFNNKNSLTKEILDLIHEKFFIFSKEDEDSSRIKNFLDDYQIHRGDIKIHIEKHNFNRIHMKYGIPNYLRGLNLGEFIYLTMCKKLKYISTKNADPIDYSPSFKAKGVWLKLVQNSLVYSIIDKNKILCIDSNSAILDIIELLKKWFKLDLQNKKSGYNFSHKYIIDPDLILKIEQFNNSKTIQDEEIKFLINKSIKRD